MLTAAERDVKRLIAEEVERRRFARLCPRCGVLPGLHRPDGSCPLTAKNLHR